MHGLYYITPLLTCCSTQFCTTIWQSSHILLHVHTYLRYQRRLWPSLTQCFFHLRAGLPFRTGSCHYSFSKMFLLPGHNDSDALTVLTMCE